MPRYFVKDGHTLGYIDDRAPTQFCILAGKPQPGGHDWKDGFAAVSPLDKMTPAALADFERFRVRPEGHIA